jgi:4-coumarate--CoA ligase
MTIYGSPFGALPRVRDISLTELIFDGVATRGDAPILIDGPTGRSLSGNAFIAEVKAIAGGLARRGVGRGTVVAIMAPNSPEFCAVFHAIAWAGGTITTVNPTYTAPELAHQLKDSGASILVTIPAFLETARTGAEGTEVEEIVVIGEAPGATPLSALMGPPLEAQVPMDLDRDVLVLPYSSGTTGLPKGVMLSQRNLVANVAQILAVRPVEPGEWTVGFLPFFHIYGMVVLANAYLAAGGGVVTMPRFDLEMFLRLVSEHRTPQAFVAPPVMVALAKHPLVDRFDLSALKHTMSAAAPLGPELSEAAARRLGVGSDQGYGMTELSPVSHVSPRGQGKPGKVGQPVPGTECRLVDPVTGMDVAPGEEGELWIRGPQVMLGYHARPDATAACLDAEGWLRTGDIARIDEEGHFEIRDRLKELIKVKGFQVAPAEVEAVLVANPRVADVAVIGVPDEEAGEVPMAWVVVPAGEERPTLEELRAWCEGRLAHYKQVHRVAYIEAIPKSASGKILRRLLREHPDAR